MRASANVDAVEASTPVIPSEGPATEDDNGASGPAASSEERRTDEEVLIRKRNDADLISALLDKAPQRVDDGDDTADVSSVSTSTPLFQGILPLSFADDVAGEDSIAQLLVLAHAPITHANQWIHGSTSLARATHIHLVKRVQDLHNQRVELENQLIQNLGKLALESPPLDGDAQFGMTVAATHDFFKMVQDSLNSMATRSRRISQLLTPSETFVEVASKG